MRVIAMALVLEAGMIATSAATTIHVPSQQSTIQAGIDAASASDTVLVAAGTYTGPANRDLDFGGKDLVLLSESGRSVTVIDAQGAGRGFLFQSGETAATVIEGFTVRNGVSSSSDGGGFWITEGSAPTLRDCRLESNHANTGGGIYVWESGATVVGCEFEGNTANNYGGGVYGGYASLEIAGSMLAGNEAGFGGGVYVNFGTTLTLSDCGFTENVALNLAGGVYGSSSDVTLERCGFVRHTGKVGAGVYLEDGTATADSCTFRDNTAEGGGGGMYASGVEGLTLTWCRFERNTALNSVSGLPGGGGGLWAYPATGSSLLIADCMFDENRSFEGRTGQAGGGYYGGGSTTVIERCTFTNNHADGTGGGHSGSAVRRECVFEGNTSAIGGGGVFGGGELIDCRLVDNHAVLHGGGGAQGPAIVVRCEFSGNSAGTYGGGLHRSSIVPVTIEDSRFSGNYAPSGGGLRLYAYSNQPVSITGCTFEGNTGFHEGGAGVILGSTEDPPPLSVSGCTLVRNASPLGASGLVLGIPVSIENTIIAFGTEGEAIRCTDIGVGVISCTDIYGNAGGDWTGCISDQLGINGNFSADPLFCNMGGGDYTLAETSPCAPEHSPAGCGLIGAFPVACVNPIGVAGEGAPPAAGRLRVTPNPMRGSGTIEWVNNAPGAVSLRLYDPLGRLVASRSLGLMLEGRQELRWDGLLRDRGLPPGVYLLELGGPSGGVDRSRVVLIR